MPNRLIERYLKIKQNLLENNKYICIFAQKTFVFCVILFVLMFRYIMIYVFNIVFCFLLLRFCYCCLIIPFLLVNNDLSDGILEEIFFYEYNFPVCL